MVACMAKSGSFHFVVVPVVILFFVCILTDAFPVQSPYAVGIRSSNRPLLHLVDGHYAFTVPKNGLSLWSLANRVHSKQTLHTSKDAYNATHISVLEGLEPVRKRPGMYIGSTGEAGLHQLVWEIVDNSVDEAMGGHCTEIKVSIHPDESISVVDNGRGIPCDRHPQTGKSSLETVLTVLHSGGKFSNEKTDSGYKLSAGLHGVGLSVVNALSESLIVQVTRDGLVKEMAFRKGVVVKPLQTLSTVDTAEHSTLVQFRPDMSIFKSEPKWRIEWFINRFNELCYLNPSLFIELIDARPSVDKVWKFHHEGGLKAYLAKLCEHREPLYKSIPIIRLRGASNDIDVEAVLRWNTDSYSESIVSYANGIGTSDGGSHTEGMKSAITKVVNTLSRKKGLLKQEQLNLPGEYIREGLFGILAIVLSNPEFESQTKNRLGNPEARAAVEQILAEKLTEFFEWHPSALSAIFKKATEAKMAAAAAKAAKEFVRKKSVSLPSALLPGKLVDCTVRNPSETELFIVEGDSAAGSAKMGRDRRIQAILPLRGKILNVQKLSNDQKLYQNSELKALMTALGLSISETHDDSKLSKSSLRYNRILIMTDADVDGEHIRLLLLTFFYRYHRHLLEKGYIYVACSPLYKVSHPSLVKMKGDKQPSFTDTYAWSEAELYAILRPFFIKSHKTKQNKSKYSEQTLPPPIFTPSNMLNDLPSGIQIQRFKGLGEMMAQQLWDTTMNPQTRHTKQMIVKDAKEADRLMETLMGEDVSHRKALIYKHSESMKLSDLDY